MSLRDEVDQARIRVPVRGNRRLGALVDAVNEDEQLKAWWHVAGVNAVRLGMSDHSWVHIQIVTNIALRLTRLLSRRGVAHEDVQLRRELAGRRHALPR